MTHFHAVPETGDGIVILTNSQRSWPFIAYILSDWTKWCGLPSIGMERIVLGVKVLWILIGLVWFFVLLQLWRVVEGLVSKERHFAPISKQSRFLRIVQSVLFLIIVAGLVWYASRDYTFISSIFPIASDWLVISMFALSVVFMLSALYPKRIKSNA